VILSDETAGIVAVEAVSGLVGGKAETDCALAVTVTAASNPTPITVDLSKPRIVSSPVLDHLTPQLSIRLQ
jgi:hypothetical protein